MSSKINSEIKLVTPEIAKEFLISNEQNRRIRPSWVNYLAYCIRHNEWRVTHQGIAFSDTGRLLDGQHRLLAIIKADMPVNLMVSHGLDESVFSAIDSVICRNDVDRTNLDRRLVECSKLFLLIMDYAGFEKPSGNIGMTGCRSTPEQIKAYGAVIGDFHDLLMKRSPTVTKLFSSVPSRCAAIANMLLGDDIDYIVTLYRQLSLGDTENLPPIARSAMRQFLTGSFSTKGGNETRLDNFVRFMTLYRKSNRDAQKLIFRDKNEKLDQVRKELMPWFADKTADIKPAVRSTKKIVERKATA
jgi:hypothetical protein